MHTQVCVVGTVATDPRFSRASEKASFCSFRLACNERRFDAEKQEWVDTETNWYTINAFRGLAENAILSLAKGDRVVVNGRLRMREWATDEKSGLSVIVDADALGHDLKWGTSKFAKRSVASTATASPGDDGSINDGTVGNTSDGTVGEDALGDLPTGDFADGVINSAGAAGSGGTAELSAEDSQQEKSPWLVV